jgi:hypothetical protein
VQSVRHGPGFGSTSQVSPGLQLPRSAGVQSIAIWAAFRHFPLFGLQVASASPQSAMRVAGVHGVGFDGSLFEQTGVQALTQPTVLPGVQRFVLSEWQTPAKTDPSHVSPCVNWITLSPHIVQSARQPLLLAEGFPTQVGH